MKREDRGKCSAGDPQPVRANMDCQSGQHRKQLHPEGSSHDRKSTTSLQACNCHILGVETAAPKVKNSPFANGEGSPPTLVHLLNH